MTFEDLIAEHLDAAYNLARWLTRNPHDAEDLVQEASLRALRGFAGFHGDKGKPWFLTIVRNTCYTWLKKNRAREFALFDEQIHSPDKPAVDRVMLKEALEALPLEFREALVLREIEGLTYREISEVTGVPIGTVMSRLNRARAQLRMKDAEEK